MRIVLLSGFDNMPVALGISREDARLIETVIEIVHAEHDGDDIRVPGKDIAVKSEVDGSGPTTADLVATDRGIVKAHLPCGIPRQHVFFHILGVFALLGNTVPVERYSIAIVESKSGRTGLGICAAWQDEEGKKEKSSDGTDVKSHTSS